MISQQNNGDDYESLPEAVRQYYTREEYLWLSDEEKADLVRANTEPEWEE